MTSGDGVTTGDRATTGDRVLAWVLVLYTAMLLATPLVLSPQGFEWFYSEEGPVERAAIVLWIAASAMVLVRIRPFGARALAFALLYLVFAAREADWHKAFTADSIFKNAYYRRTAAPFEEKLIAFLVAVVLLVLFAYACWIIYRFLWRERGWRSRSGGWLLAGWALLFATKVLDRTPAVLADEFGVHLAPIVGLYFSALEEGMETALPLMLGWSAWISQRERRYLN